MSSYRRRNPSQRTRFAEHFNEQQTTLATEPTPVPIPAILPPVPPPSAQPAPTQAAILMTGIASFGLLCCLALLLFSL